MRIRTVAVVLLVASWAAVGFSDESSDPQAILDLRQRIQGTRWSEVASLALPEKAWLFSIDLSRYEKTSAGYFVWLRSDCKPDGRIERLGNYDRFIQHVEFDCKQHRERVVTAVFYSGMEVLNPNPDNQRGPDKWTDLVPGSLGDKNAEAVCTGLAKREQQ